MAVLRSVLDTGGLGRPAAELLEFGLELDTTAKRLNTGASGDFIVPVDKVLVDPEVIVDAGSHDDVDRDDEVEAESFPQDSKLDSVSVEPVLPIDIVLPICFPILIIGLASEEIKL